MSKVKNIKDHQVFYLGRWVSREHFKTFVYNETGQKLAKSYEEFQKLIESGLWYLTPEEAQEKMTPTRRRTRKPKDGTDGESVY